MNQIASKRICRQLTRDLLQGAKPLDAVDVFHKTHKSNASMTQSLTRTVREQSNQVFTTICAAFSLEGLLHDPSRRLDGFFLASSDSDFTPLATPVGG